MPDSPAARVTAGLLLGVLVMLGLNLKVRLSTSHPRFDPSDETGYFRAESALQYRYARLAARGRTIPPIDRDAQFPEGLDTRRALTSWMERLAGASFRLFASPDQELRWFALLWVGLVSSLSIPAFYFCAWRLTKSRAAALAGAAAYGLSWPAQANLIASFRLEALGLPLIFASLACCAAMLDPEEKNPHPWGAAAAGLLFLAFGSWHLSRFYLATYALAAGYAWARGGGGPRLKLALAYPAGAALLAVALIPSARESLFIASPGAYGHVYGLVFEKLRHGLSHPADPAALSPVVRLEWTGPSNSPDMGFALFAFLPLALTLLPRVWAKRERSTFGDLVDALFFVYLAGTALSSRLAAWLAFFLALAALRLPSSWTRSPRLIGALALVALLEGAKSAAPSSLYNPFMRLSAPFSSTELRPSFSFAAERELLGWLRRHAGASKPTLAGMGLSAEILTYAATPVLLHPKWEAAPIREKTADFARTLFESEDAFAAYCGRHGAKLFVYSADALLDETPEGLRYASGSMALGRDTAAFLFHFKPEALKKFRLVFQNEGYRVYELAAPVGGIAGRAPAVYDLAQYGPNLDVAAALKRMEAARLKLLLARILAQLGRGEQALSSFEESFAAWPPDPAARAEYETLRAKLAR